MTAEMRWGSSTFVYSYLIFTELTFQPLSLGDNLTREEMKRLGGGRSGSSSFFVLLIVHVSKFNKYRLICMSFIRLFELSV